MHVCPPITVSPSESRTSSAPLYLSTVVVRVDVIQPDDQPDLLLTTNQHAQQHAAVFQLKYLPN